MSSQRVKFSNANGFQLSGIIEWPDREQFVEPKLFAIFSHCFTCTKDLKLIVRISRQLAKSGIATLRFDFTGLGDSQGNFSDTNYDANLADVRAAAQFLAKQHSAPSLLIGHSLGGAAMMVMSSEIRSAAALVTIAAPSSTKHLANYLATTNPDILENGEGAVVIGGRTYRLKAQLIENLKSHDLAHAIEQIEIPHLIFHPTDDDTLPFWHAERLFELTGGTKSMISLDGADHLLVNQADDVFFVADSIALWLKRFID